MLVLHLLDRLVDPRIADMGAEPASYMLKTLNLTMLKLLQYAPRNATVAACITLLIDKVKDPAERQMAELILKCLRKLAKTMLPAARSISLAPLLARLNELYVAFPGGAVPLTNIKETQLAQELVEVADGLLKTLVTERGAEVRAAFPAGADRSGLAAKVDALLGPSASMQESLAELLSVAPPAPAASIAAAAAAAAEPLPVPPTAAPAASAASTAAAAIEAAAPVDAAPLEPPPLVPAAPQPFVEPEAAADDEPADEPADVEPASLASLAPPSALLAGSPATPQALEAPAAVAGSLPTPKALEPPAAVQASGLAEVDANAAAVLSKLEAMKKQYNIKPLEEPASAVEGEAKPESPSQLSVAALRSRLARLKK